MTGKLYFVMLIAGFVVISSMLTIATTIIPISDSGCSNYQSLRSHLDNATAVGCDWNGTAWHFNTTKIKLAFDNDTEYLT